MSQLVSHPAVVSSDNTNYESFLGLLQDEGIHVAASGVTTFASEEDFQLLHEAKASAWRSLPHNIIYKIQHVKKVRTPNGQDSVILHLYAQHSTVPQIVWASTLLATELLKLKEIRNLFIKSLGLRKSITTGREYYNYQLVQKQ